MPIEDIVGKKFIAKNKENLEIDVVPSFNPLQSHQSLKVFLIDREKRENANRGQLELYVANDCHDVDAIFHDFEKKYDVVSDDALSFARKKMECHDDLTDHDTDESEDYGINDYDALLDSDYDDVDEDGIRRVRQP